MTMMALRQCGQGLRQRRFPLQLSQSVASISSKSLDLLEQRAVAPLNDPAQSFDVFNPADPTELVGSAPLYTRQDAKMSIERSGMALQPWRDGTTAAHRSSLLRSWSNLIQQHEGEIAEIITAESGKPFAEARGEVQYGKSFLDFYASEAIRTTGAGGGFLSPTPFATAQGEPRGHVLAFNEAVGVTAMITPWNFPIAMITRKVAPALAVGCTALLKPSELTPLTAVTLHNLAIEAGIPEGVFELITTDKGNTASVGEELCTNETVRKITFTGSTAVGKLLMRQGSDTVKRMSLELGGNAPFIVFDDADLDQAIDAVMTSKFRNAGQTCVASDRFLVDSTVHDAFVDRLSDRVRSLPVGAGMDPTIKIGPLITTAAAESVRAKMVNAIGGGASCVVGGPELMDIGPSFVTPTILTDVDRTSELWSQETFGPVVAISRFHSEEEAISVANEGKVGLAAYFCAKDAARIFRVARSIETGMIGVNEGIISTAVAPFGGVKESGLGREGSSLGISEYLETKYVLVNC